MPQVSFGRRCTHIGEPHPRGTCPSKHDYSKCCPHKEQAPTFNSAAWQREHRREVRSVVLARYGGKCACCGQDQPQFLTLDHKNGDGKEHRRLLPEGRRTNMYYWAYTNSYPEILQILCFNCNYARNYYGACH